MTHEELQAIKARAEAAVAIRRIDVAPEHEGRLVTTVTSQQDVPALVAEVERLRAIAGEAVNAIEHLWSGNDYDHSDCCKATLEKLKAL